MRPGGPPRGVGRVGGGGPPLLASRRGRGCGAAPTKKKPLACAWGPGPPAGAAPAAFAMAM